MIQKKQHSVKKINHREKFKSSLIKKGDEGGSHEKGVQRIIQVLIDREWAVTPKYPLFVTGFIGSFLPAHEHEFYHEYDIFAQKTYSNKLTSRMIIEIDGKIHNGKEQRKRDETAQRFAEFFINDVLFERITLDTALTADPEDIRRELFLK